MNPASQDLAGYRVAVIDDNRNFRDLMRAMLRAFGVRRVDAIAEPDDLVPFLCQNYVDLVFIDLIMPGINGISLAREIRHKSAIAKRNMPIVLVTGHASRAAIVQAVSAGIDDVIVKPVSPQTIFRRTRRLLLKPPVYVAGTDGYFGPDVAERRHAVERRMSADRWRLLKAQNYRVLGAPGLAAAATAPGLASGAMPDHAAKAAALRAAIAPKAPPPAAVSPSDADAGVIVPGLSARSKPTPPVRPPRPVAPKSDNNPHP